MEWWWECRKGFKGSQLLHVRQRGFDIAHWGAPCQGGTAVQQGVGQGENCIPMQNMSIERLKVGIFQVLFCLFWVWLLQTDLKLYLSQMKRKKVFVRWLLWWYMHADCLPAGHQSLWLENGRICVYVLWSHKGPAFVVCHPSWDELFSFFILCKKKRITEIGILKFSSIWTEDKGYLMLWHLHLASV